MEAPFPKITEAFGECGVKPFDLGVVEGKVLKDVGKAKPHANGGVGHRWFPERKPESLTDAGEIPTEGELLTPSCEVVLLYSKSKQGLLGRGIASPNAKDPRGFLLDLGVDDNGVVITAATRVD